MDIDEVLDQSSLVFEGEVISSTARWNASKTSIATYVEFLISDVIQGEYAESSLTLRYTGGTVDDMTLTVDGVVYPKIGERGIYFVLSTEENFIHPLVGWSQGHFRIVRHTDGTERITTEDRSPVMGLQSRASRASNRVDATKKRKIFSMGTANLVEVADLRTEMGNAMSKESFKQDLINRKLNP
jgi:hypothetical protein